uniref:protein FAM162A-like n=1 Tax=Myxine glutinosa TaxID=7769 RepID=UPI00358FE00F
MSLLLRCVRPTGRLLLAGRSSSRTLCHQSDVPVDKVASKPGFTRKHHPSNFDRFILVWAKKYRSREEVPLTVSAKELDSARESARIRTCYIMIALTLAGCLVMAISGKKAAREKKSLSNRNLEQRAKLKAEAAASD